jgi:hypothetical protein
MQPRSRVRFLLPLPYIRPLFSLFTDSRMSFRTQIAAERRWAAAVVLALAGAWPSVSAAQTPADLPACRVGMHVPRVGPLNYGAVILEFDAVKGSYKVKSDSDGLIDWVPAYKLRTSCVGAEAKPIDEGYFVGKWSLFVGPTPQTKLIDGKGYIIVGPGAHVPPLEIFPDHRYAWVVDSHTIVKGQWRSMAATELRSGTKAPAILLLNGEDGKNWEVSRTGVNQGNNRDAISVDRMDLGLSAMGTRLP